MQVKTFWPNKPDRWVDQIATEFRIANSKLNIVTDSTKFDYLISQLERIYCIDNIQAIATRVEYNKYQFAKDRLTSIFREVRRSEEKRIKKLLVRKKNLGDLEPSQLHADP